MSDVPGAPSPAPTVLVVGAASRDVTDADPRGWRLGGAVTFGSLTLARLGMDVRALVGADAEAAKASELDLVRSAGVDVEVAPLASGPVFENIEQPGGRRQRCLSVSDPIPLAALPRRWRANDALLLGPVAGELGAEWAAVDASFVALGWQGLLRRLVPGADVERVPPASSPLLEAADLVAVSDDDLDPSVPYMAVVAMIRRGATLVLTRGDLGGTLLPSGWAARSDLHPYPAIPSNGVVDATGAGDVFLATLLAATIDGSRLGTSDFAARLTFAAAAGSLAVEAPGLSGVPTLEAVRRRVVEVA